MDMYIYIFIYVYVDNSQKLEFVALGVGTY